jgi:hypothetical protein
MAQSGSPSAEEIAHVIDPDAFKRFDGVMYNGEPYKSRRKNALDKAHTILARFPLAKAKDK